MPKLGPITSITIEVAFAGEQYQEIISLSVPSTCCLQEAIKRSGILSLYPPIDLTKNKVGIFGKLKSLDTPLAAGDRIEIYRPLIKDPNKNRKERAKKQSKSAS